MVIKIEGPVKRGRKQKEISFSNSSANSCELSSENNIVEKVILHLKITLDEIKEFTSFNEFDNLIEDINNNDVSQLECGISIISSEDNVTTNVTNYKHNIAQDHIIETTIYDNISLLPTTLTSDSIRRIKMIKTNIHCWWCTYHFDTPPICMPEKYIDKTQTFKVSGCFCSFNCVLAYKMSKGHTNCYLVRLLAKRILGNSVNTIKKAPSPYCLEKYGGNISIEVFRETFTTTKNIYINISPMVYIPYQIEESRTIQMMNDNIRDFSENFEKENITISKEKVKAAITRKNKKSTNSDSNTNNNTLDKIMGFVI
jgi:hypothetical protein